ncbi:MAG: aldo/keto reductase [Halocynthiibacter sp.]
MQKKPLGQTGLTLSELCLGTMTWGTQNTAAIGHAQIDMALDHGINCIDTAEMYPVNPASAKTIGRTEEIVGDWFAKSGRRDDVILATKITGKNGGIVRDGRGIDATTIVEAVNGSLRRLQTDVIDIYQFHWPNRGSFQFRQNWDFDPSGQDRAATIAHMQEALDVLQRLVEDGKIRHFGLSNESAWGTAQWLRLAAEKELPPVVSIQNEYSLLCRLPDTDLAELCVNESVGLMAFSPLAAGLLSGKYQPDITPEGSRRSLNPTLSGRLDSGRVWGAVAAYREIAERHGLGLPQMALAWCRTRPFMASAIFGATNLDQLKAALESVEVVLSDEILAEISKAHRAHPMPF